MGSYIRALIISITTTVVINVTAEAYAADIKDMGHVRDHGGVSRLPHGDIYIEFASACCGIDGNVYDAIVTIIASDPDIGSAASEFVGREGELVLSVVTVPGARERAFKKFEDAIPKDSKSFVSLRLVQR